MAPASGKPKCGLLDNALDFILFITLLRLLCTAALVRSVAASVGFSVLYLVTLSTKLDVFGVAALLVAC